MERIPDIDRAAPPEQVAGAIYGARPEVRELNYIPPPINPWGPKVEGDGRLLYTDDDAEERELSTSVRMVARMFEPAPVRGNMDLADLPILQEDPDAEERELYTPVRKLFYPDANTILAATPAQEPPTDRLFRFVKVSTPAPKATPAPAPTYKTRVSHGVVWREAFDGDGILQSANIVTDPAEIENARRARD